ncbi:MAG: anti-sigma factor [Acidimicrobiales bacterium]|jgi:anti-sigma factor RsiW
MAMTKDITCHQAVALVSDYLEGALSRRDRQRLERHLEGCEACSAYLEQMRITIAISGSVGPEDLPAEAVSQLLDVFEKYQRDKSNE